MSDMPMFDDDDIEELKKMCDLSGDIESVTNDDMCGFCSHTAPDHWGGCPLEMSYWKATEIAARMRRILRMRFPARERSGDRS